MAARLQLFGTMMHCPECNRPYEANATACANCGLLLLTLAPHRRADDLATKKRRAADQLAPCKFCGSEIPSTAIRCKQCSAVLLRCEYAAEAVPPFAERGGDAERYTAFATIVGTLEATETFNADEARRTCRQCGTVSSPFPMRGWSAYVQQTRTANAARRALGVAARDALGAGS